MTATAFFLILLSAGLHASWNLIAKKERMTLAFYAILCTIGAVWSSFVRLVTPLSFFAMPADFHVALGGALLGELCYGCGIVLAYRVLDMSTAYPMMRSLPLLFIAGITTACGMGKPLTSGAIAGMAVVFVGCLMMPLKKFSDFKISNYMNRSMLYIILVACGTTLYTIFDSRTQQVMRDAFPEVSKPMVSLTYYSFRAVTLASMFWIIVLCRRRTREEALEIWRKRSWMPLLAGVCSSMTYLSVLLAMNFVTNVSYVPAFRQLGLLIGMLEGILILKEKCTATKVVGITLILGGLVMIVL
ncbi:MAG: EamA family transporter [Lentisphaeria bacterium]|nr:EamA family transporter [Lentisphaeria bacterium]